MTSLFCRSLRENSFSLENTDSLRFRADKKRLFRSNISVRHDAQPLQRTLRMDRFDVRQLLCDQPRVAAGRPGRETVRADRARLRIFDANTKVEFRIKE